MGRNRGFIRCTSIEWKPRRRQALVGTEYKNLKRNRLFITFLLFAASLGASEVIVGKVVQIAGSVVAKQSFQGKRTLTTGSPLYVSDEIIVGQDSGVEISYTDGSLLDLGENTDFHIRDYQY